VYIHYIWQHMHIDMCIVHVSAIVKFVYIHYIWQHMHIDMCIVHVSSSECEFVWSICMGL
jgi:hypothetical protein